MREMKDTSLKCWSGCTWKKISLDLFATSSGRVGTDDTTLIERVELSSFGAARDRLLLPSQQFNNFCISWRYPDTHTKL